MGITLKDYVRSMLAIYKDYPEMKQVMKELYEEWYGEKREQRQIPVTEGSFCMLDQGCRRGS